MSYDYNNLIKSPLKNIRDALDENKDFHDVVVGAVQPDNLTYPTCHIIPDQIRYEGNDEFRAFYDVFFYYDKSMSREDAFYNVIEETSGTMNDIITELRTNEIVAEYEVLEVNFQVRDYQNSLLDVLGYRIRVKLLRQE